MNLYDRDSHVMPDDWFTADHRRGEAKWATEQRVGRTQVGDHLVSTVWLHGIDHNYAPDGPPIIFETMIFGPRYDQELDRYATEEAAMRGHLAAVDRLRAGQPPFAYLEAADR